jgi:NhaP-type Na+/H+ or K+/H+ antiporter
VLIPWLLLVGAVLIVMAFSGRLVQRLPLSPAMVYLGVGVLVGPWGLALVRLDPLAEAKTLEVLSEVAVLIALFAVGLRLRLPQRKGAWAVPVRLASGGMVLTVAGIAVLAWALLGLPWPMAVLLGAMLAPTDPVLASDVQVHDPGDRDAVRLSITAEGGLNDGTAFPAVMLGLGLLGAHELGAWGWRWWGVDLVWAVAAGLGIGRLFGLALAWAVQALRRHGGRLESEEFLVIGAIALAYGLALAVKAYGFLAVFAAGASLSHAERARGQHIDPAVDAAHSDRLINFSAQLERLAEVALVLLVGVLLASVRWSWWTTGFALAVLFVARPLAVVLVTPRDAAAPLQRRLIAWFGVRGVGSVYYLAFALTHGLTPEVGRPLVDAVLVTIVLSIVLHGTSATPLMRAYRRRRPTPPEKAPLAAPDKEGL